jgi:hypothetical protein
MELPGHGLRGQRYADPAESRGEHHTGDRFTVNKNAIAIEDDHGSLRCSGQREAGGYLFSESRGENIVGPR